MGRRCLLGAWAIAALSLVACTSDGSTDPDSSRRSRIDAGPGIDASGPTVNRAADIGGSTGDGGAFEEDAALPRICVYPSDCPNGDCVDGVCVYEVPERCNEGRECHEGETCGDFDGNYFCFLPCELEETCSVRPRPCTDHFYCPHGTSCHDGRCINSCETDIECTAGWCDNGQCRPGENVWTGDQPVPFGQRGQVYAGIGQARVDYSLGVSMAGYGARDGVVTPYAISLLGSDRVQDAQDVKVIALSDDRDIIIVIRLPLGWSTDFLLSAIAVKLQEMTRSDAHPNGINYLSKLVTAATHSHSQVARFWNLIPDRGLGIFGYGEFSPDVADRLATSFAIAVARALDDMRPAKFGWHLVEDFDPEGRIRSDRRSENPQYVDDQMLVWRIDDLEGRPRAGMVNFAFHPNLMNSSWLSADAAAGVEVVATERLSAMHGLPIPVMYTNGNAGDVSARGDDGTRVDHGKIQACGHRTWPIFRDAFEGITTRPDVDLEIVTRRIPISYDLVGYDREQAEFRSRSERSHVYGAFACVDEGRTPEEDAYRDGEFGCRINVEQYVGRPVPQFHKTTLTAFRIGDLAMVTLPGEPMSRYGRELADDVMSDAEAHGWAGVQVVILGYAQDHQFYLLRSDDWLRGGYEASTHIWGWRGGDYIYENAFRVARQLWTEEVESNETGVKPTWWPSLVDDALTPVPGDMPAGQFELDAPTGAVRRGSMLELTWHGGHPQVDLPTVVLETAPVEAPTRWGAATRPGGVPYDLIGFESMLLYEGNYGADHRWTVRWEIPFDMALGPYRLRIDGRGADGAAISDYRLSSNGFEIVPTALLLREIEIDGRTVRVDVNYPEGPTNDDGASPFEAIAPTGHLLRMDPFARFDGNHKDWSFFLGPRLAPDEPVNVRLAGAGAATADVMPADGRVSFPIVVARDDNGGETVETVNDWPASLVAIEAPGAGRYTLTVTDGHGNAGSVDVDVPE